MAKKTDGLAVFDSGIGGLTVVDALLKRLPNEQIDYLADTLHLPYGNKTQQEIEHLSISNTHFLLKKPIKALVIACNTASALAYDSLKQRFNIPIFDVITPAVEVLEQYTQNKRVAVLGTESTIHSGTYEKLIQSRIENATVFSIACPLLVSVIEENMLGHKITKKLVQQYLSPLQNSEIDTLILGCTHYPLLKELIQQELGDKIKIIDSAKALAEKVALFLKENKLENSSKKGGVRHYFVSSNAAEFQKKGSLFFNQKISSAKEVELSEENPHD